MLNWFIKPEEALIFSKSQSLRRQLRLLDLPTILRGKRYLSQLFSRDSFESHLVSTASTGPRFRDERFEAEIDGRRGRVAVIRLR